MEFIFGNGVKLAIFPAQLITKLTSSLALCEHIFCLHINSDHHKEPFWYGVFMECQILSEC